jgi:hypothetical protein
MNNNGQEINRQAILTEVTDIVNFVETAYREQQPVHAVEYGLWKRMLQLGWHLLSAFFGLYGTGDEGQVLELGDGRQVNRLPAKNGDKNLRRARRPATPIMHFHRRPAVVDEQLLAGSVHLAHAALLALHPTPVARSIGCSDMPLLRPQRRTPPTAAAASRPCA